MNLAGHFKLFAGHLIGFNYGSSLDIFKFRWTCPASPANFAYSGYIPLLRHTHDATCRMQFLLGKKAGCNSSCMHDSAFSSTAKGKIYLVLGFVKPCEIKSRMYLSLLLLLLGHHHGDVLNYKYTNPAYRHTWLLQAKVVPMYTELVGKYLRHASFMTGVDLGAGARRPWPPPPRATYPPQRTLFGFFSEIVG